MLLWIDLQCTLYCTAGSLIFDLLLETEVATGRKVRKSHCSLICRETKKLNIWIISGQSSQHQPLEKVPCSAGRVQTRDGTLITQTNHWQPLRKRDRVALQKNKSGKLCLSCFFFFEHFDSNYTAISFLVRMNFKCALAASGALGFCACMLYERCCFVFSEWIAPCVRNLDSTSRDENVRTRKWAWERGEQTMTRRLVQYSWSMNLRDFIARKYQQTIVSPQLDALLTNYMPKRRGR